VHLALPVNATFNAFAQQCKQNFIAINNAD